ncbi:Glycosyl hydrolase family 3 N terminal domain protein [Verrucomicrobiia bacterium DG1235]|nr:Glycosyl hydrolase family 3 N terminal domain protein [Verrucomicrobiae bacterium DG1235]
MNTKKPRFLLSYLASSAMLLSSTSAVPTAIDYRPQAVELVSKMTLEEKASLCSGGTMWTTKPIERLDLPSITLTDGPHGVRMADLNSGMNALHASLPATCFPTAPALASTWNLELLQEVGEALGQESQTHGVQILLGPGTNLKRSPLGGRNFEYYSEDPLLSGTMAAAWINGVQSKGVGTSLKHFAANNQEWERMAGDSIVAPKALHEMYLRSFEIPVRIAEPWTIMCAYNKVNGEFASQNKTLLTDILRHDWGYEGIVLSDWGAVDDRVKGVKAGLNLEMPSTGGYNDRKIVAAVQAGELDESVLDQIVVDMVAITLKAHAGIQKDATFDQAEHHALARRVAGEGSVLLKNENATLPLSEKRDRKIAIIGEFAKRPRYQGAGSSQVNPTQLDNSFAELTEMLGSAQSLSFAPGYDWEGDTTQELLNEAHQTAQKADHAIVFIGLPDSYESEGFDRASLELPQGHNLLVESVASAAKRTTVVLMNGSPVAMPWVDQVDAIVEAYLGGQAGGGAIADVLTGAVNPSGKLAETFPQRIEETPTYPNFPGRDRTVLYGEGVFIGYRHYDAKDIEPLFPFGHGLSYTTFELSNLELSSQSIDAESTLEVKVTVKNTGSREGAEVVQAYIDENNPEAPRPVRELAAFKKVFLQPGQSQTISLQLGRDAFEQYDAERDTWIVRSGEYTISLGNSSRVLPLEDTIALDGGNLPLPPITPMSTFAEVERHPTGKPIYDNFIAQMQGDQPKLEDLELSPDEYAAAKKGRETMLVFLREIPLKKLVMLSQGAFTEEAMLGIIRAVNSADSE